MARMYTLKDRSKLINDYFNESNDGKYEPQFDYHVYGAGLTICTDPVPERYLVAFSPVLKALVHEAKQREIEPRLKLTIPISILVPDVSAKILALIIKLFREGSVIIMFNGTLELFTQAVTALSIEVQISTEYQAESQD